MGPNRTSLRFVVGTALLTTAGAAVAGGCSKPTVNTRPDPPTEQTIVNTRPVDEPPPDGGDAQPAEPPIVNTRPEDEGPGRPPPDVNTTPGDPPSAEQPPTVNIRTVDPPAKPKPPPKQPPIVNTAPPQTPEPPRVNTPPNG